MRQVKNPLIFIFITILIDCIGIRIVLPVAASIVAEVSKCDVNEAIKYSGWMMTTYALMQFLFSPLLGSLSDKWGRKPVLLIALFGLGIDYLFLATANSLPLLFLGRIIAGICGASLTTGFAYVADISAPEKRAQNFGLIGAAVGIGFIIGPFIGGICSEYGTRVPFIIAAILSLLNCLYGLFILPESLKPENRRAFSFKRANPIGAFYHLKNNLEHRHLLISLFLIYLAGQVLPAVWPFYTKYKFHWSDLEIGYSITFVGLMVAIVKAGLIKFCEQQFGIIKTIYLGLIFSFSGLCLFAITGQSWMLYLSIAVYCLGGIAPPSLQGIISSKTGNDGQGELQGIITSLMSLSNIISPLIMTGLFHFFTNENTAIHLPGIPFLAAALAIFLSFTVFFMTENSKRRPKTL
jgi:DHA1 family tetracycline resistance protein-like MFS transporter